MLGVCKKNYGSGFERVNLEIFFPFIEKFASRASYLLRLVIVFYNAPMPSLYFSVHYDGWEQTGMNSVYF